MLPTGSPGRPPSARDLPWYLLAALVFFVALEFLVPRVLGVELPWPCAAGVAAIAAVVVYFIRNR